MPSEYRSPPDGEQPIAARQIEPGNTSDGPNGSIDPAAAAAPAEPTGAIPKRRGPKPGSKRAPNGTTKTEKVDAVRLDLSSLAGLIIGVHATAALITQSPELILNGDEGKEFAKAVQNVMRHYDVAATQKTVDIIALIGCAGFIYVPRGVHIWARLNGRIPLQPRQAPQQQRPQPAPAPEPSHVVMQSSTVEHDPTVEGFAETPDE